MDSWLHHVNNLWVCTREREKCVNHVQKSGKRSVSLSNWQSRIICSTIQRERRAAEEECRGEESIPRWGIINKPCVQGSIRYASSMWTIRSRMHTRIYLKNSPSWNKIWSKVQHVRTMLLPHKLQVLRAAAAAVTLPWPMHMPRWHWTLDIAHRTHGTFDLDNGGHIGHGGHRTGHSMEKLSLFVLPGGATRRGELAQLTVGLAVATDRYRQPALPSPSLSVCPTEGMGATIWPSADQLVDSSSGSSKRCIFYWTHS